MKLYQTKKFLYSKGNHQKMKRQLMEWKKIFKNHISDKGVLSKMYSKQLNSNNNNNNNNSKKLKNKTEQMIKWVKYWIFSKIDKLPTGMWYCTQHHLSSESSKSKPQWNIDVYYQKDNR